MEEQGEGGSDPICVFEIAEAARRGESGAGQTTVRRLCTKLRRKM